MATREDYLSLVRSLVWSGEFDEGDVAVHIRHHRGEVEAVDKVWLLKLIRTEFELKRTAEETWPKVTDFDRLDRAFTLLEAQGVIALHRAGYTQSDGHEEVNDAYNEAGGKRSEYKGYCFYTEQDQESTLDRSDLYIAFGDLSGNDSKGVKVGQMLHAALEREGFSVEWDGTFKTRLIVNGFLWQRLRGASQAPFAEDGGTDCQEIGRQKKRRRVGTAIALFQHFVERRFQNFHGQEFFR